MNKKIFGMLVCMLLIFTVGTVSADWYEGDGHKMHFPQLPDPNGWDVDFHDWRLGDDWKCSESGPVTDIHFWYSWAQDMEQEIEWIKVSIWSDDPGPPSKPLEELWFRQFTMDEFIINGPWDGNQGWWHPSGEWIPNDHNMYWQINIVDIEDPWIQEEGVIYWLVIEMPYFDFPFPAIGWKTTLDHWNDNAVFGVPGNWISLWDPINPDEPIDFAFVITGEEEEPIPDLICDGSLSWTDVKPGDTVTGTFQVGNGGDPGSLLNWAVEISSLPTWGTWSFSPASGTGLADGSWTTVTVTVIAPSEKNKNFTGDIKVINTDDSTDFCKIDVKLATPKNKPFDYHFSILNWLFEHFPNAFPILRYLL